MVRFPSVQTAARAALDVLFRYPFPLVAAAVSAAAAWGLVDGGEERPLVRILLAATLGLPLFVAVATWASRDEASPIRRWGVPLAGGLLLAGFWAATAGWMDPVLGRRYAQLSLALHLLVAVLAYAGHDEPNGFWQYNRRLFERFLVSALFSGVLFLGLALAIAAIDQLFGVDVDDEYYARLWFLIAFVFNTWYFLGGVPRRLAELESASGYPAGLKIFAQYILVPLVFVYLLILTAYLGRVAVTREWPSGWIGYLVSGVAVLGILALLLVHPVRARPENRWVGTFARGFWFALIPALAMLFLAIFQRIEQYGITENRYFLLVFASWLAGLSVYFIVRPSGSISVIPWSLGAVALGTAFGPWGAYAVSEQSQTRRLHGLLETHGLLAEGRVREPAAGGADIPFEDRREIAAGLRYLLQHHGPGEAGVWWSGCSATADSVLADLQDAGPERRDVDAPARALMAGVGLEYVDRWSNPEQDDFSVHTDGIPAVVDVREWDYVVEIRRFTPRAESGPAPPARPGQAQPAEERFQVTTDEAGDHLVVREGDRTLVEFPVQSLIGRAREAVRTGTGPGLAASQLRFEAEADGVRARLQLRWLNARREEGRETLTGLEGRLLLDLP